jgi:hypothetical protein
MRETLFAELQEGVRDAVEYRKGARKLRVDRFNGSNKLTSVSQSTVRQRFCRRAGTQ